MSAGSSTTRPRAALSRYADGFMRPIASASISFSVSAVSGQLRAMKSACGSSTLSSEIACTAPPPSEWNSDLRLCAELLSIFAALIIRRKLMLNPAFSGDLGGRRRLNTAIAAMIRRSTEKEKGKRFGRCRGFGLRRFADPLLQFGERHLAAVQWQDLIDHQLQPFDIVVQIHTGWIGLCRRRGVGRRRGIDVDFDQ